MKGGFHQVSCKLLGGWTHCLCAYKVDTRLHKVGLLARFCENFMGKLEASLLFGSISPDG